MARFVFRFETVLRYRRHRRDLCRTLLARLFEDDRKLEQQGTQIDTDRRSQLNEIRELAGESAVDIDRAAARRYYAGQLGIDTLILQQQRQELGERIELCRKTLVEADRDVRILEKLEEKHRGEYDAEQLRRSQRESEDVWFSTHAMEYSK